MVQPGGVEPPTYRSVVCRSIQLSYGCTCPTCGGRIVEQPVLVCNPSRRSPYSSSPVVGEEAEA